MKRYLPFLFILVVLVLTFLFPAVFYDHQVGSTIGLGDVAWLSTGMERNCNPLLN
jgi:Amt family ammonium transporter